MHRKFRDNIVAMVTEQHVLMQTPHMQCLVAWKEFSFYFAACATSGRKFLLGDFNAHDSAILCGLQC